MKSGNKGFTLVELLVVMVIIASLAGIGMISIPPILRNMDRKATEAYLMNLTAALEAYRSSEGTYPPTTLRDFPGVGAVNSLENCGISALVMCMNSKSYSGAFDFEDGKIVTLSEDGAGMTQVQLTRFGDRKLYTLADKWGTTLAYVNAVDYANPDVRNVSAVEGTVKFVPWQSQKTKTAFRRDSFQLVSAGPDRVFNTEDDVTNFDRN
jgi:prepilin-type N-terminal cleavage/methylation domain-containing protein